MLNRVKYIPAQAQTTPGITLEMQVYGPHLRSISSNLAVFWSLGTIGLNHAILDKPLKFSKHYLVHI